MNAGKLKHRLTFQKRVKQDDGHGNETGAWADQFTEPAAVVALRGGEAVISARLTGTQPFIITVRSHTATRLIDATWRAIDARGSGVIYNLKQPADTEGAGEFLDIPAEAGVNT